MKYFLILFSLSAALLTSIPAYGGNKGTQIIKKGEKILRGKTTQALMTMRIQREDFTRTLKLRAWSVGNQRALVQILSPRKEQGVSSLRVKGNMWNYLPKVDRVVRVPTSLMLQSWMGSDFTNDDLMKSSSLARDYHHKVLKSVKLRGEKTNLILCRPKKDAAVVWGKVLYWARTKDDLPVKQEFYDEDGNWIRTLNFHHFRKMDDRVVPTKVVVTTVEDPKNSTIVTYQKLLYDRKLSRRVFEKETLRTNAKRGRVITAGWSFSPVR